MGHSAGSPRGLRPAAQRALLVWAIVCAPRSGVAQGGGKPYALKDVVALLRSGVRPQRVLMLVQKDCLAFPMSATTDAQIRQAGGDELLVAALRSVCSGAPPASQKRAEPEANRTAVRRTMPAEAPPAVPPATSAQQAPTPAAWSVYGAYRLGMSLDELIRVAWPGATSTLAWAQLPVASEYESADVRYLWRRLRDAPPLKDADLVASCYPGESNIVFLFLHEQLFRISIRLFPDCVDRDLIIRRFAQRYGLTLMRTSVDERFAADSGGYRIFGNTADPQFGAHIEFVVSGAPMYKGQNW